jgi:WG containing repeat
MIKSLCLILLLSSVAAAQSGVQSCDDKLFPIVKQRKLGFIDNEGHEVIRPRFSDYANVQYFPDLPHFREGLAAISENGRYGYIDCTGKFAIAPKFASARAFSGGVAAVREMSQGETAGRVLWIDHTGRVVYAGKVRHVLTDFHEGFLLLADEKRGWEPGYVNSHFDWAIPAQPLFRGPFHDGLAVFGVGEVIDRKFGYIDRAGKILVPAKYDRAADFSEGLAGVCYWPAKSSDSDQRIWHCGFINTHGREVIPTIFKSVSSFSSGHAIAEEQNGNKVIIDKWGKVVRAISSFEVPGQFREGVAVARKAQSIGFINTKGDWVIPPQFAGATDFSHGLAMVQLTDKEYGYINKAGKLIWQARTSVPPMVFIPSTFAAGAR